MREFLLIGGGQGVIMAITLLLVKNPINARSNRLFSLSVFIMSIFLLVSSQDDSFREYPKLFMTSYCLIYLYCPIYYLNIKSLVYPQWSFKKSDVRYFLPSIAYCLLLIKYFLMTNEEMLSSFAQLNYADLLSIDGFSVSMNLYLIYLSHATINENQDELPVKAAGKAYKIIHLVLFVINIIWATSLINEASYILGGWHLEINFNHIYITMSSFVVLFAYLIVVKNYYFVKENKIDTTPYKNVSYEDADLKVLAEKIKEILKKDRPFLNPSFTLSMLAKATGSDKFKVSYTLNKVMNTTFTIMVGQHRVESFIKMVESGDYDSYSLEGISKEAGFNTKSTFYKAFRENKGTTPKEYFSALQHSKLNEAQPA